MSIFHLILIRSHQRPHPCGPGVINVHPDDLDPWADSMREHFDTLDFRPHQRGSHALGYQLGFEQVGYLHSGIDLNDAIRIGRHYVDLANCELHTSTVPVLRQ